MKETHFVKLFFARPLRAIAGVAFCAVALLIAAICGGFNRQAQSVDILSGKWTGNIVWNDASGREYSRVIHTAVIFEPGGMVETVLTLPSGALGGSGTYTLKDGLLTVHCTGLAINGHSIPLTVVDRDQWFHGTATYNVAFDGTNLTLTSPNPRQPTPTPSYPLLTTSKPIVLGRVEINSPEIVAPTPKE